MKKKRFDEFIERARVKADAIVHFELKKRGVVDYRLSLVLRVVLVVALGLLIAMFLFMSRQREIMHPLLDSV